MGAVVRARGGESMVGLWMRTRGGDIAFSTAFHTDAGLLFVCYA